MTTRARLAFDIAAFRPNKPSNAPAPDPAAGPVALAVAMALLRALKGRGLLSSGELDDLLADAQGHLGDPAALRLLGAIRPDLEREETE